MPMTEDLAVFLDATEHATEVQLDGQTVSGILDRGYADVDGIATTRPTFTVAAADAPYVEEGSVLVVGTDVYSVRTPQPDGTGLVILPLQLEA